MTYLGLDLGTSGLKALLIDADQRVVASANASLSVSRPRPGWSEQDPASWIAAAEKALAALKAAEPKRLAAVRGIGLSGQMHGATVIDAADKVLYPCILWNDVRSHAEAAELDADPAFREISGNIVFPGFTAPKLVWLQRHSPEIFDKTAKVLLPKDYLRLWLTGEHVSEMSDAAGTAWLDTGGRCWSEILLAASGMAKAQMPRLVEGSEISGTLRPALADGWGMEGDVIIAGGAGDNAASAIGVGAVGSGRAFLSIGTSGVLFAANDCYRPNAASAVHAFCHAVPETWHQMGVILSATDCLNWLAGVTASTAADLADAVGDALEPPGGVTFLPYLSGERTPHNDARIRGALTGLDHATDRAALTRAVMEGTAFAFRDCLAAMEAAGTTIGTVIALGGGSNSAYWLKAIATALERPMALPADGEYGAAFGAARLALIAAEAGAVATIATPPAITRQIEPETALLGAYRDAYQRYRALYPAIGPVTK